MKTHKLPTVLASALLVVGVISAGCVADRPSRNGVFNENQYLRKDFLIQGVDPNGQATQQNDPGWLVRATVTETGTPNLIGNPSTFGVYPGEESDISLVRFRITQDSLQLLNQTQLSVPQNPGPAGGQNFTGVTDTVTNAWPATNVDLKYQVSLDGEKTNFYQENQELDWQVRQWVKLQFDKNDFSDLAPLGFNTTGLIGQCATDATATLVDGSFNVEGTDTSDPSDDYFEFTVQVGIELNMTDTTCQQAYGAPLANALRLGRTQATANLKYSFKRATPVSALTYKPFEVDEKDPIHVKYGPWLQTVWDWDPSTQLLAANQYVIRWDPMKPLVWYFDKGFPDYYKPIFLGTQGNPGIMQGTNAILEKTGKPIRLTFLNYNDASKYGDGAGPSRNFGDIRYNIMRWVSDFDTQDLFAGATPIGWDPRTGEVIHGSITFNDGAVRDYYVQRIDAFLQTVGASAGIGNSGWQTGPCSNGTTAQIVNQAIIDNHNGTDSLYVKMQNYLGLHGPDPADDHIGPQDMTAKATEDADFMNAYFTLVPYETFQDPDANLFVTREGGQGVYGTPSSSWNALKAEAEFQAVSAQISNGHDPTGGPAAGSGATDPVAWASFAEHMKDLTTAHRNFLKIAAINGGLRLDAPGAFSMETVMEQDAQQCVNGQWQTQDQWIQAIIDAYWQQVFWHEFGHSMGMSHQFMGNIDQLNFTPQTDASGNPVKDTNGNQLYDEYSSSVMEYNSSPARLAWKQAWGAYDQGCIGWMYSNDTRQADNPTKDAMATANLTRSGEVAGATQGDEYPYKDPFGFCTAGSTGCPAPTLTNVPNKGLVERAFIRCDDTMTTYTPLCRQGDLGVTPSQIVANSIDDYEWQYLWRNFRNYRKVWDESAYANAVAGYILDQRRFLSQWAFDWSPGEISTLLYRVGVQPTSTSAQGASAANYYAQLTYKFLVEMSKANQMVSAFAEALIQETAGERPYATVYDKFYGDVTQQGIILDKYYAMQNFVGLWVADNYDQNQAGAYISTWSSLDYDDTFQSVSETAIASMIGSQYAVYPYFIPTAVSLFAQDTHNPAFLSGTGRVEAKDWIGGRTFGGDGVTPTPQLIAYFQDIAYKNSQIVNGNRVVIVPQPGVSGGTLQIPCASETTCQYDVTNPDMVFQDPIVGAFVGPDGLNYVYMPIPSRNQIVLAREDRNIVTWKVIEQYNADVIGSHDDGASGAYDYEYQVKYTIDAYETFESGNPIPTSAPASSM